MFAIDSYTNKLQAMMNRLTILISRRQQIDMTGEEFEAAKEYREVLRNAILKGKSIQINMKGENNVSV